MENLSSNLNRNKGSLLLHVLKLTCGWRLTSLGSPTHPCQLSSLSPRDNFLLGWPQGFSLFSTKTTPRKLHCFDSLIAKGRGTKQAKSNVFLSTVGGLYPRTVSQSKPFTLKFLCQFLSLQQLCNKVKFLPQILFGLWTLLNKLRHLLFVLSPHLFVQECERDLPSLLKWRPLCDQH